MLVNEFWPKVFPFLTWKHRVTRQTLGADLLAGFTNAIIVLPQGVAFAMIAGLPPVYGLYTAMISPIIAGLWGSSMYMISGPMTPISLLIFDAIRPLAEPGTADFITLTMTVTLVAGLMQILFSVIKLGGLVNFVSSVVLEGFTAGVGILILVSQLKHVTGIAVPAGAAIPGTLQIILANLNAVNLWAIALGSLAFLTAMAFKRFLPKWPNLLLAMLITGLLSYWLDGQSHDLKVVGELPSQLPPWHLPLFDWSVWNRLAPSALAIAMVGLIQSVAIGKTLAMRAGDKFNSTQEFFGQGLSNMVGSFFSNFAGSGSFTRSNLNYESGAKTPMSAIFSGVFLMGIVLFIAPLTAHLPIAAMGGIIIYVALQLIKLKSIRLLYRANRAQFMVFGITFLATLFFALEYAVIFGVMASLFFYLQRTSQPFVVEMIPDPDTMNRFINHIRKPALASCPQLSMIRVDGSLFFGSIEHINDEIDHLTGAKKFILIIADGVNFIDVAGSEWLVNKVKAQRALGGQIFFSGLKRNAQETFARGGFKSQIGDDYFFDNKKEAIEYIFQRLDAPTCQACDKRIFWECNML